MATPSDQEKPGTQASGKPDEQKPAEKTPTAEELKAMADENVAEFFDNDRLGRVTEESEEEKPVETPAEKPVEQPAEKPAEVPPKKDEKQDDQKPGKLALVEESGGAPKGDEEQPRQDQPRGLTDDEIDDVADRIAQRTQRQGRQEERREEKKDPFAGFDGAERDQLQAVSFLSKTDPKFKGRDLVEETKKFWTAEQDYIQKWEKKHEGETFNADDPSHADFYRRNSPAGLTDDVLDNARLDMRAETKISAEREKLERNFQKKIDERFAPIEREKLINAAQPAVAKSINGAVAEMVSNVLPDMVGETGLTEEVIKKIESEDPIAMELLSEESGILNVRVKELEHLRHLQGKFEFKPDYAVEVAGQTIKPHQDILDVAVEIERNVLTLPVDKQRDDTGRTFITREQRSKLIQDVYDSDLSSDDKERRVQRINDRTWSIDFDDIRAGMIAKSAKNVRKTLDIANKRAEHVVKKAAKKEEKPVEQKHEEKPAKPSGGNPKPIAGTSDLVDTRVPGNPQAKTQAELNANSWFD